MLAVHRPRTAGGRKCGICSGWTGEAKKKCSKCGCKRTWAQQSVAAELDGKQGTNFVGSRGLEIRQKLEQLQARAAVIEKQSTDSTPAASNPKVDPLKLTLKICLKMNLMMMFRAVLVDKHRDAVLEATRMKPLGARLDDCEAAVGRAAKRRQEAEDIIKIAEVVRRNAEDEENKLKAEVLQLQSSAAEKTYGSEDSIAQMNASLAKVLSEMKWSQFVEAHAIAEAEKLMESLSVGLSRVAQSARQAAESQMSVEIPAGTPQGDCAWSS